MTRLSGWSAALIIRAIAVTVGVVAIAAARPGAARAGPQGISTAAPAAQRLPLSDPGGRERWVPYAPLTDEFDGSALDAGKWLPRNPEWNGREPGFFSPANVFVGGGALHLAMRRAEPPESARRQGYHTYTCAAVQSQGTVLYGYFEARAKAMNSAGSSAFWFYRNTPQWWTEIDVFEIGAGAPGFERKVNMNLHVFRRPADPKHHDQHSEFAAAAGLADGYHVYGLDWNARRIRFYFDGKQVRDSENTVWHQPLTLNFDSETMGDWFGLPRDQDLPSFYDIDYVRAWKPAETQ